MCWTFPIEVFVAKEFVSLDRFVRIDIPRRNAAYAHIVGALASFLRYRASNNSRWHADME